MDLTFILIILAVPLTSLVIIFYLVPISLIVKAARARLQVLPTNLIGMRLRNVDPYAIVLPAIKLIEAEVELDDHEKADLLVTLEAHNLAGGDVSRVVAALIEAKRRQHPLTIKQAMTIDLTKK